MTRRPDGDETAGADSGSSFGSVFRNPRGESSSTQTTASTDVPDNSGRTLGGATRRAATASEARAARLNALEKKQQGA